MNIMHSPVFHLQGSFPSRIVTHANSVACMRNTHLLATLFNETVAPEVHKRFPRGECRQWSDTCELCLANSDCLDKGLFLQDIP